MKDGPIITIDDVKISKVYSDGFPVEKGYVTIYHKDANSEDEAIIKIDRLLLALNFIKKQEK